MPVVRLIGRAEVPVLLWLLVFGVKLGYFRGCGRSLML